MGLGDIIRQIRRVRLRMLGKVDGHDIGAIAERDGRSR